MYGFKIRYFLPKGRREMPSLVKSVVHVIDDNMDMFMDAQRDKDFF